MISVKKIPMDSTMAEFWKVAIIPVPPSRASDAIIPPVAKGRAP
jgi:hypothetical protein